jgi:hypothetical protein
MADENLTPEDNAKEWLSFAEMDLSLLKPAEIPKRDANYRTGYEGCH